MKDQDRHADVDVISVSVMFQTAETKKIVTLVTALTIRVVAAITVTFVVLDYDVGDAGKVQVLINRCSVIRSLSVFNAETPYAEIGEVFTVILPDVSVITGESVLVRISITNPKDAVTSKNISVVVKASLLESKVRIKVLI